jgi:hypothetical protein
MKDRRRKPMPEMKIQLQVNQTFTEEEYQRLQMGVIPHQMEDKWHIHFEENWLFFHRSWTGYCLYQIHLESSDRGWNITEAWANSSPDQSPTFTVQEHQQRLLDIIDYVLLGKKRQNPYDLEQFHLYGQPRR